MNKLTFKMVWDEAFAAGYDQADTQCGAGEAMTMDQAHRDAAFERWFANAQNEELPS